MDKTYSVTLADGSVISGLKLNGNNYISKTPVTAEQFAGKLTTVVISDGEESQEFTNMDLIHVTKYADEYWFALRELSEAELKEIKLRADLEFIAMMADIEL